jgi:ATP-dependent Clp protease ATP-binding subunit ClpA
MTSSSIFSQFGYDFLAEENQKKTALPFKDHPQIPFILDTLSRQQHHHAVLITTCSEKIIHAFSESIAHQLTSPTAPKSLRNCYIIYFDMQRFAGSALMKEQIARDFLALSDHLRITNKRLILILNQVAEEHFNFWLMKMLPDDLWRVVIFAHPSTQKTLRHLEQSFTTAPLMHPDMSEIICLLKIYRSQLENFHHVTISDETITNAYTMAAHYLPGHSCFDKTLDLLDSAAARSSSMEQHGQKSIVSSHLLAQVVASWTQIPLTHLQHNKFQAQKFVEALRARIFGQDTAINFIASLLQNACINVQNQTGPLCSFLFAGPEDVGKTSMAYAMAEHLFGHKNALLHVHFNHTHYSSLSEVKIHANENENQPVTLFAAIQRTPYAVVLLENVDQLARDTFELFKDIFTEGYVFDAEGNKHDFRHAIVIATTHLSAEHLNNLTTSQPIQEASKVVDLMQLVLNEHVQEPLLQNQLQLSPQELCDELLPKLVEHFSAAFLQKVNVVPFVPLDYAAFEKVVRLKVKMLAQHLLTHFSIELSYAPEIVKFLAHEAFWRKSNAKSFDNLLNQYLYSCVAHEILLHAESKNRSKRLLIQLNDAGQLLRCEFVTANEENLYNL